jgi:hypothetical protein
MRKTLASIRTSVSLLGLSLQSSRLCLQTSSVLSLLHNSLAVLAFNFTLASSSDDFASATYCINP